MAAPFPSPTKTWHTEVYDAISPTNSKLSAKGKTIVITGGGTGIGAETAKYFAQAGASRIALLGRREQPLLDTKASIQAKYPGVEIFTASASISKKEDVDNAFAKFADGKPKIDVFISNAASVGPIKPIKDADIDKFLSAIHSNVDGALYLAQAFLRYAAEDAVVIDVNSNAAHLNYTGGFAAYNTYKLAVYRFWDSLAIEHPEMSVYHIQPGIVRTAMNDEAGGIDAVGFEDDVSLPAGFNLWLASPEAHFAKNKFLWTNWDVEELKARAKEIQDSPFLTIGLSGWPFGGSWESNWKS